MMTKQKMKILSTLRNQGQNFLLNINLMMETSRSCPNLAELRPRLFLKIQSLILAQKLQPLITKDIISENIFKYHCSILYKAPKHNKYLFPQVKKSFSLTRSF